MMCQQVHIFGTAYVRGNVLTSLCEALFSSCVLVEKCVFLEDEELALGRLGWRPSDSRFPVMASFFEELDDGCR
jgi:hypothetical protein